nr:late blight resistance protein R1-A-like [Ipomoea batatas]GME17886.1 late blight resistance protein R1-A-like [Ipomoea batatas]
MSEVIGIKPSKQRDSNASTKKWSEIADFWSVTAVPTKFPTIGGVRKNPLRYFRPPHSVVGNSVHYSKVDGKFGRERKQGNSDQPWSEITGSVW